MTKQTVLIICYSHHAREPRVIMQCDALKNHYNVITAGYSRVQDPQIGFINLSGEMFAAPFQFHMRWHKLFRAPISMANKLAIKLSKKGTNYSSSDLSALLTKHYDLVICHHPGSLLLGIQLQSKKKCPLIFNAHEIYAFEFEDDKQWMSKNFFPIDNLLKKYLPITNVVFSVNEEICSFYEKRYNCRAIPVKNSKPVNQIKASSVKQPIQIIHHGGAMRQRRLELMAEAVLATGGKFELTFMLTNTDNAYLQELKERYEVRGINFKSSVPFSEIVSTINQFDIGIYILPEDNINQHLALPNKIFEFIQAKLAVICSPNVAMKRLVEENGVGRVAKGFTVDDMTETLMQLTPHDIQLFKIKAESAAYQVASSKDEERIYTTVNKLLN